jgi:hypothetical protein
MRTENAAPTLPCTADDGISTIVETVHSLQSAMLQSHHSTTSKSTAAFPLISAQPAACHRANTTYSMIHDLWGTAHCMLKLAVSGVNGSRTLTALCMWWTPPTPSVSTRAGPSSTVRSCLLLCTVYFVCALRTTSAFPALSLDCSCTSSSMHLQIFFSALVRTISACVLVTFFLPPYWQICLSLLLLCHSLLLFLRASSFCCFPCDVSFIYALFYASLFCEFLPFYVLFSALLFFVCFHFEGAQHGLWS